MPPPTSPWYPTGRRLDSRYLDPAAVDLGELPEVLDPPPGPPIVGTELATAGPAETPAANHWDASADRLTGEQKGSSKLTWAAVDSIRELHRLGRMSSYALARRFGVSRGAITAILANRTWREETRPPAAPLPCPARDAPCESAGEA